MKNYILTAFFAMFVSMGVFGQARYNDRIMSPHHSRTFIQPRFHSQPRTYVPQRSIMFRRPTSTGYAVPIRLGYYHADPLKSWGAVLITFGILGGLSTASYHANYYWGNPCGCTPYNPYFNAHVITGYSISGAMIIAGSIMMYKSNHSGVSRGGSGTKYRKGSKRYWRNRQNSSSEDF
jgi:hypothetical protein